MHIACETPKMMKNQCYIQKFSTCIPNSYPSCPKLRFWWYFLSSFNSKGSVRSQALVDEDRSFSGTTRVLLLVASSFLFCCCCCCWDAVLVMEVSFVGGTGWCWRSVWRASKKAAFQKRNECQIGWSRRYVYKYSRYGSQPGTSTGKRD